MSDFTFKHANQPDNVTVPANTTKANFDSRGNELRTALNRLIDELSSADGARNIGVTAISGVNGSDVQTVIENLNTKIGNIDVPVTSVAGKTGAVTLTKGDVGLGNVTNDKQATKTEFDDLQAGVNAHLAETMPHEFKDGTKTYKWGLKVVDGVVTMVYEEVV